MYQIVDREGTVLGEYHNIPSAQFALVHEFKGLFGLVVKYSPKII